MSVPMARSAGARYGGLRAASMLFSGLCIFRRVSLELGLAASAAEQHLLACVHEPMRRIRLRRHAADGIARRAIGACMALMIVAVVVGVHS